MSRLLRVGLAWQMGRRYGEDSIRGIGEYAGRYGPWRFSMDQLRDFDARSPGVEKRFDGILIGHDDFRQVRAMVWPRRIPVVAVHRLFDEVAPWRAQPDNVAVGRLVAEEFAKRGFRHLAFCQSIGMPTPEWDQDRIGGFASAARRTLGGEPLLYAGPVGEWGSLEYGADHAPISDWLRSLPKPVGIMAADDMVARHLMHAAAAVGRVPEEISVIGVNNEAWTEVLFGGISSVELDGFRAGYVAAEMLHQLMEGNAVEPKINLVPPRRLVVRRSSSTVAIDDPDVVMAVRYIAERATSGLTVEQVVDALPLSRRTLERRFSEAMGRSLLQEIRGAQVERAKLLLVDPTIPLAKVTKVSGFTSIKAMSAIFFRIEGMTPTAYRKKSQNKPGGSRP